MPFGGKPETKAVFGVEEGMPEPSKTEKFAVDAAAAKKKFEETRDLIAKGEAEAYAKVEEYNQKFLDSSERFREQYGDSWWKAFVENPEGMDLDTTLRKTQKTLELTWGKSSELAVQNYQDIEAAAAAYNKDQLDRNQEERKDDWATVLARVEYAVQGYQELEDLAASDLKYKLNLNQEEIKKLKEHQHEIKETWERVGYDIENIWISHTSAMRRGTETFSEGVKGIIVDMADYVISQFERMAMNMALFGNQKGEKTPEGGGLFGLISGLFTKSASTAAAPAATSFAEWLAPGGLGFYQKGGSFWADHPMAAVFGEGGEPERVDITPFRK